MVVCHKGTSRSVLAFPHLGIVLKVARIRWSDARAVLRTMRSRHRQYRMGMKRGEHFSVFLRRELLEYKVENAPSLKQTLLSGIVANWRERRYYRLSDCERRQLLQPTYLSIFGLLNVQKYGKPMKPRSLMDPKFGELYNCYFAVVGPALNEDGHLFAYEGNFHLAGNKVRFLDYASLATQRILSDHGPQILRRFVPPDPSEY